jgi:hypothetical protein
LLYFFRKKVGKKVFVFNKTVGLFSIFCHETRGNPILVSISTIFVYPIPRENLLFQRDSSHFIAKEN